MLTVEPADKEYMVVLSESTGRLRVAFERTQASGDDLTGAMRRGVGLAQLTREIYRAERHGSDLAVAFIDLDGLRELNRHQGHAAGDRVLRLLVERLFDHMRPYDLVVRLGGDEFLCVLPDADVETAQARLAAVAAGSGHGGPTPSFSVRVAPVQPRDTSETLLPRAPAPLRARPAV